MGEHEMEGVGNGGAIFEPIQIETADAVERGGLGGAQRDGDHNVASALPDFVASLPGSASAGRAVKHASADRSELIRSAS
jgi:hypothetical protein